MISLDALLRYSTPVPWPLLSLLKYCFWGFTIFVCSFKRVHILKGIYLSALCFLLFSGHVYEYYYTMLIGIFAVAIVVCPDFQKIPALILVVLASGPNIFFALHYFHVGFMQDPWGPNPSFYGWQLIVLSKVVPLLSLAAFVLFPDLKLIYQRLWEINQQLQVFGDGEVTEIT